MLEIKNLHAKVTTNQILRGVDLRVNKGEVHAIMGPNGSGKSTLAQVLAGRDVYLVTEGEVVYEGKNLLEMTPGGSDAVDDSSELNWPSTNTSRLESPSARTKRSFTVCA